MMLKVFSMNGDAVRSNPEIPIMGSLAIEKRHLSHEGQPENGTHEIIGNSPALKLVLDEIGVVAPTDSTVLILGETGTGKPFAPIYTTASACFRFRYLLCATGPRTFLHWYSTSLRSVPGE